MCVPKIPDCMRTETSSRASAVSSMLHLRARRPTTLLRPFLPGYDPVMYLGFAARLIAANLGLVYCRLHGILRYGIPGFLEEELLELATT